MVFLLAPDSFKECMTAKEACQAMERGILKAMPHAKCIHVPMADGGEGTMQALVDATDGRKYSVVVEDPLGRPINAFYGILGDGKTGILEMASASGIHLVAKDNRNPLITSTYGTGQLINALLEHPIEKLVIGIGGSATNDGGAGMAMALGAKLLTKDGKELSRGGGNLDQLASIDISMLNNKISKVEIEVACDVTNPLTGTNGASYIFGPQKGATPEMVKKLDENLAHYAAIVKSDIGKEIATIPGAGAAGGLGAGLMAFTNAKISKGIDLVLKYSGFEHKLAKVDWVFTGEGSIDHQTQFGKTPFGVAQTAMRLQKPVIAFAGRVGEVDALYKSGIKSIFCIMTEVCSLEKALLNGPLNLELTTERVVRLL